MTTTVCFKVSGPKFSKLRRYTHTKKAKGGSATHISCRDMIPGGKAERSLKCGDGMDPEDSAFVVAQNNNKPLAGRFPI
jgi:translation elongation factor P/translation initiation factor 5A